MELDGIEIKGKPIKVFSSLEEWDQHIANYKETQKSQEAAAKEEAEEGDGEMDQDGDEGANGDAEMDDGQVSFSLIFQNTLLAFTITALH